MTRAEREAGQQVAAGPGRLKLSAVIITHNEAENLGDCLKSLAFCDEIVIVDGASTDDTIAIAAKMGARIVHTGDFPGFGLQKQRALDEAQGEWVLSIDADERIPDDLARTILATIANPAHAGYRINRRTWFLGRFLKHGGWYPDRVLRLARRDSARFTADPVHERLEVSGSVGDLDGEMIHLSYRTIDDVLTKQRRYAMLSGQVRRERGSRGGLWTAMSRSSFAFAKHYLLQRGFLDGRHGFVAAVSKAQECFWRYLAAGWERRGP